MNKLVNYIRHNDRLKKIFHWLLIPPNQARPRVWVRLLINPFFSRKGKGALIRRRTRMDILPFNRFELGRYSVIEDFCTINNGVGDVIIGDHSLVGMSNVIIGPVTIGSNVIVSQNVVISGLNHSYEDPCKPISRQGVTVLPITIEDDCWIAANSVITAGITVGKHSVVAAGTIVTKDVPPYSLVAGNPGKIIKRYDFDLKEWIKPNNLK